MNGKLLSFKRLICFFVMIAALFNVSITNAASETPIQTALSANPVYAFYVGTEQGSNLDEQTSTPVGINWSGG